MTNKYINDILRVTYTFINRPRNNESLRANAVSMESLSENSK